MIFAARADSGVILIDLGWGRAEDGVRRALREVGATPNDVKWAFLTHAHRDHIAGWTAVPRATFVLGADEVPLFTGVATYRGPVPRLADRLNAYRRPTPSEVTVLPLGADTLFALGRDTLRAYRVPGHTPGSMAYLFRETLFVGDAANRGVVGDFRGTLSIYSDSVPQSRASMTALFARLDASGVRWRTLCTAHAKCAVADSALRAQVTR
jgi:glyoxylase-like metal-dependent hydrolase (beta-lactamase superfamily II)